MSPVKSEKISDRGRSRLDYILKLFNIFYFLSPSLSLTSPLQPANHIFTATYIHFTVSQLSAPKVSDKTTQIWCSST